jgi:Zn-dependent protease with chaperone function
MMDLKPYLLIGLGILGAEKANSQKHRNLLDAVEKVSGQMDIDPPVVYVIPDQKAGAMLHLLTGDLIFTQGLLDMATKDELCAVFAHEMRHKQRTPNLWGATLMVAVGLSVSVTMLTTEARWASALMSAPIGLSGIALMRHEEKEADKNAAQLGYGEALNAFLSKRDEEQGGQSFFHRLIHSNNETRGNS